MEKLLKWSIQSSDPTSDKPVTNPDPELLAQLFGGKDESTLMKEAIQVAINKDNDIQSRETALDNFEMLVENLDNANNIEYLGLWPHIIDLLKDPSENIRKLACWIVGTAAQNNPKSQNSFVSHGNSIGLLLHLAQSDPDHEVSYKAVYALSSVLAHCPPAYEKFSASNGWQVLSKMLSKENPNNKLRFRAISLVHSVSHIEPVAPKFIQLRESDIISSLISILKESSDLAAQEKVLHVFATLQVADFEFTAKEKIDISDVRNQLIESNNIFGDEYPFSN